MELQEAIEKIAFDISEGEDEIVKKLVESYNQESDIKEFVYKNRHYLDQIDESRIQVFLEQIGTKNIFVLQELHDAFKLCLP